MTPNVITVHLAVGTMAALLTALEFVLSTVSALSIRASLHGLWLTGLHRGGTAPLDLKQRLKRAFRKDIASACLGIWLVLGVALVESNLHSGVLVSDEMVNSTECVSMYGRYQPIRLIMETPPFRTTIEPWVLRVAATLGCGDRGIATVGVGGATDSYGMKQNMSAPVCASEILDVQRKVIKASLTAIKVEDFYLQPEVNRSESFILFPHHCDKIGKGVTHLLYARDGTGPCGERGISRFFTVASPTLQTTYAHQLNTSNAMHERLCFYHGNRSVVALPDDTVRVCIDGEYINGECLRREAPEELVHSVRMSNLSALFVGSTTESQAYACPNATVEQEFVFINPAFATELEESANANLSILVVTSARVIDGFCEPTVNVLGQAALLYTADADWRDDQLTDLDKRTLYHAYMMAVSSSQFPLNNIGGIESPTVNGSCYVRPVSEVTEIAMDWRLFIMISGLICALITMTVGVVFRMIYTGESWKVGSAQWSLSRLLNGLDRNNDKESFFEVVALPADEGLDPTNRRESDVSSKGTSSIRRIRKALATDAISPSKLADVQYQYSVRATKLPIEADREDNNTPGSPEDLSDRP